MLDGANFDSDGVEKIMMDAIQTHNIDTHGVVATLETICSPFFLSQKTRGTSKWEPKDPVDIVQKMVWYEEFREHVQSNSRGMHFDSDMVQLCYDAYMKWFKTCELRAEQKSQKNIRNMAIARMHRNLGNRYAVLAIWEEGMPRLNEPLRAALQQRVLTDQSQHMLRQHIDEVIQWLQRMATSIQSHKNTPEHAEARRRSGNHKNQSGLDAAELVLSTQLRTLHKQKARAERLCSKWKESTGWVAYGEEDRELLSMYWDGDLGAAIKDLKRQRDRQKTQPTRSPGVRVQRQ
jgi:hypothetical protein